MEMNSKLLCRPFCASLGKLPGSPGKAAARTGYLGLMGGTKKSGISAAVLFLHVRTGGSGICGFLKVRFLVLSELPRADAYARRRLRFEKTPRFKLVRKQINSDTKVDREIDLHTVQRIFR